MEQHIKDIEIAQEKYNNALMELAKNYPKTKIIVNSSYYYLDRTGETTVAKITTEINRAIY